MEYDEELKAWFRPASPSWGLREWLRWKKTRLTMTKLAIYLLLEEQR